MWLPWLCSSNRAGHHAGFVIRVRLSGRHRPRGFVKGCTIPCREYCVNRLPSRAVGPQARPGLGVRPPRLCRVPAGVKNRWQPVRTSTSSAVSNTPHGSHARRAGVYGQRVGDQCPQRCARPCRSSPRVDWFDPFRADKTGWNQVVFLVVSGLSNRIRYPDLQRRRDHRAVTDPSAVLAAQAAEGTGWESLLPLIFVGSAVGGSFALAGWRGLMAAVPLEAPQSLVR